MQIRLTVSAPYGHTPEQILRLGLREEAEFNGDTAIDLDDFFGFVDAPAWNGMADLNGYVEIDFDDFFVVIERFEKNNAQPSD